MKAREGRDDDGDGRYNEDGRGGVVLDRNLPHRYQPWTADGGRWPADQPESRALLEFGFAHPEIAQVLVLGASNTLLHGAAAGARAAVRQPERARAAARGRGAATRSARRPTPWTTCSPPPARPACRTTRRERVRGLLSLGPREYPQAADLAWWREASVALHRRPRRARPRRPRVPAPPPPPGSVTEWAYYQFGVVSFAVDLWSPPCPPVTALAADTPASPRRRRTRPAATSSPCATSPPRSGTARLAAVARGRAAGRAAARSRAAPAPYARTTPSVRPRRFPAGRPGALLLDLARWRPVLADVEIDVEDRGGERVAGDRLPAQRRAGALPDGPGRALPAAGAAGAHARRRRDRSTAPPGAP